MPLFLLFVQTGSNPTHTPQPHRQLLLLLVEPIQHSKNHFFFKIFIMAAATKSLSTICCASLSTTKPPMPLLIQRSVRRRCRLSLVAFLPLFFLLLSVSYASVVQADHTSSSFLRQRSSPSPAPVVVLLSAFFFFAFASPYLGCCLPVIDAYVHTQIPLLLKPSISAAALTRTTLFSPFPYSIRFVRFSFHCSLHLSTGVLRVSS